MRRSNTPSTPGRQLSKGMTRCVMSDEAFSFTVRSPNSLPLAVDPLQPGEMNTRTRPIG